MPALYFEDNKIKNSEERKKEARKNANKQRENKEKEIGQFLLSNKIKARENWNSIEKETPTSNAVKMRQRSNECLILNN